MEDGYSADLEADGAPNATIAALYAVKTMFRIIARIAAQRWI